MNLFTIKIYIYFFKISQWQNVAANSIFLLRCHVFSALSIIYVTVTHTRPLLILVSFISLLLSFLSASFARIWCSQRSLYRYTGEAVFSFITIFRKSRNIFSSLCFLSIWEIFYISHIVERFFFINAYYLCFFYYHICIEYRYTFNYWLKLIFVEI